MTRFIFKRDNIPFHIIIISHVHTTFSLRIHPSVDTCFHILVIVNSATMTWECSYFFNILISVFWGVKPINRIAGLYGTSIFSFSRTLQTVFHMAVPVCITPSSVCQGSNFSTSPPTFVIFCFLSNSHPHRCVVSSHCGFKLKFPDNR